MFRAPQYACCARPPFQDGMAYCLFFERLFKECGIFMRNRLEPCSLTWIDRDDPGAMVDFVWLNHRWLFSRLPESSTVQYDLPGKILSLRARSRRLDPSDLFTRGECNYPLLRQLSTGRTRYRLTSTFGSDPLMSFCVYPSSTLRVITSHFRDVSTPISKRTYRTVIRRNIEDIAGIQLDLNPSEHSWSVGKTGIHGSPFQEKPREPASDP